MYHIIYQFHLPEEVSKMVCPLGLVQSNHPPFLLSHLFSVSWVTFFLGLFPCLAGAWLPIVFFLRILLPKNLWEVSFLRSSMWKNVFISSFNLIWYSKLKIISLRILKTLFQWSPMLKTFWLLSFVWNLLFCLL